MLGNTFGQTKKDFNAGRNVWHSKSKVYPVGGKVDISALAVGDIVPAGSMAVIDTVQHTVVIVAAAAFDATQESYAIGDVVVYGGVAYVCKTAISAAAAWDASKWTAKGSVADYSASSTYAINAIVVYGGELYKAKQAISTAEAWTAAHWTKLEAATAYFNGLDSVNGLLEEDIYIDENAKGTNGAATASVVYEGVLFVDRTEKPIPTEVYGKLPLIKMYKEA